MSNHRLRLSDARFDRIQPLPPNKVRGVPRVDDRRVVSGIVHAIAPNRIASIMRREWAIAPIPAQTSQNG